MVGWMDGDANSGDDEYMLSSSCHNVPSRTILMRKRRCEKEAAQSSQVEQGQARRAGCLLLFSPSSSLSLFSFSAGLACQDLASDAVCFAVIVFRYRVRPDGELASNWLGCYFRSRPINKPSVSCVRLTHLISAISLMVRTSISHLWRNAGRRCGFVR